ncbi:MAG: TMEM43 family protein [Bacteroidales bacterium]|nr:TMEM43 family protein [Bacteroidales bacterium]
MAYQETTTTNYGTRVKRSLGGIGTGLLMFIAATALLWWNEGRAVKTDKMLNEAERAYVDMENPNKKDPAFDGELVCASALATTADSLIDSQFGIGANAIALRRQVEYYQWVEHSQSQTEDKLGGKEVTTTTYTYSQEWVGRPVQSAQFKDPSYQGKNMVLTTVDDAEQWAEAVSFGAYRLNDALIRSISSREPMALSLSYELLRQLNANTQAAHERFYGPARPDTMARTDELRRYVHISGNELYYGLAPSSPQVGDVRVTFEKVVPARVTIIAQVDGDTFKPYKAKNGKRFQTLVMGRKGADEIFEAEHSANTTILWVLRVLGVVLVVAGLKGVFNILQTLLKVLPFLANIIGWGVGMVCTIIGVVWSLIVIALAWLFYRPLLGIGLLVLAAALVWLFAFKGKDKLQAMASKPTPEAAQ